MAEIITRSTGATAKGSPLTTAELDQNFINLNLHKVDKEAGKGLSDANFTQDEKTKLADIASEATKNRNDSENADKLHAHSVEQVSGLGYAATAPTVGDGAEVMRTGAGGWMGQGLHQGTPYGYPASVNDVTNQTKVIRADAIDNGVAIGAAGIHFAVADTWGRLRVNYSSPAAWIQGGVSGGGSGWTAELYHSGNLLNIGTAAAAARSALELGTAATKDVGTDVGQVVSNSGSSLMGAIVSASINAVSAGFWEITLPYAAGSTTMLAFQIKEYSGYSLSAIEVSGYLYGAVDNWYLPVCTISGTASPIVKFGRNAAGYAVIVVSTNSYSGIGIYNAVGGYGAHVNLHGATITWHEILPDHVYVESHTILTNTSANTLNIGTTAAAARSALGLGSAATKDVGTAVGQIKPVGDVSIFCLDIDDETQRGRWYANDTTVGVKPTTYGIVNTYGYAGDSINQEYVELVGGGDTAVKRRFCRNKYGANAWSPWVEYYHTGNLLNIGTTAAAARSALGLGTAATRDVGTNSGNLMEVGAGGLLGNDLLSVPVLTNSDSFTEVTGSRINLGAGGDGVVNYGGGLFLDNTDGTKKWLILGTTEPRVYYKLYRPQIHTSPVTVEMCTTGNILQTTGTDYKFPMSQAATTEQLNKLAEPNNAGIKAALNATGEAPIYACRAWVNFNGDGTVAIRGSGNVSSITDNGVGQYTVNFTTAMVDANYTVTTSSREDVDANENAYDLRVGRGGPFSTTNVKVVHGYFTSSNVYVDCLYGLVSIFR